MPHPASANPNSPGSGVTKRVDTFTAFNEMTIASVLATDVELSRRRPRRPPTATIAPLTVSTYPLEPVFSAARCGSTPQGACESHQREPDWHLSTKYWRSPCFLGSESGFDRIRENHLTGYGQWAGGSGGFVSVSAGIQTAMTTVPARRHPVGTRIFTWHRISPPRRPESIREPRPTMRAGITERTTFPHTYFAAILGAVHGAVRVDATVMTSRRSSGWREHPWRQR